MKIKQQTAKQTNETVEVPDTYKEALRMREFGKKIIRTMNILKDTPENYGQVLVIDFKNKKLIKTNKKHKWEE